MLEYQEWLGMRYAEKCEFEESRYHFKVGTLLFIIVKIVDLMRNHHIRNRNFAI